MKTFGVVREGNKKSTRNKKAKSTIILSIICHRYSDFADNHLIPWGEVFVNKINDLATQSWKKILA
jgi:hypothetical protein